MVGPVIGALEKPEQESEKSRTTLVYTVSPSTPTVYTQLPYKRLCYPGRVNLAQYCVGHALHLADSVFADSTNRLEVAGKHGVPSESVVQSLDFSSCYCFLYIIV